MHLNVAMRLGVFSLSLPLLTPSCLFMSNSAPTQRRRDEREWTTYEQKAHLQSKQEGYVLARDQRNLRAWLGVELEVYFNRFPTQPVTKEEMVLHGQTWSVQEKRLLQEKVSV